MKYQEKVSTRADVRALFEKVKANPAVAQYRGYTESKSYGWDAAVEDYVKCDGEVWFDNPAFDQSLKEEPALLAEAEELLDDEAQERTVDLEAECADLRAALAQLNAELAEVKLARDEAVAKKNAACAILCNLREVLEKVLSYPCA